MLDDKRRLPVIDTNNVSTATPVFEKIAIIGLGLIGGSIALASRDRWPSGLVIGVDSKSVLEQAMVRHAIDVAADDPVVIAEADLVVLAAPVRQNIKMLTQLEKFIKGSAIVTDVGSTKREIIKCSSKLPSRLTFVGGHPLGGSPRGGINAARADLFVDRPWLFTPVKGSPDSVLQKLGQFVSAFGSKSHVITPEEHDRLLAFLSHLPQLTASTLMHVVGSQSGSKGLELTGRGLSDTTRLASSSSEIWKDICATNEDEVSQALDVFIKELQALRQSLSSGDSIDRIFNSAATWRAVLNKRLDKPRSD